MKMKAERVLDWGVFPRVGRYSPLPCEELWSDLFEFFSEGFAVDTQNFGGLGFVATDYCQYFQNVFRFDFCERPAARLGGIDV